MLAAGRRSGQARGDHGADHERARQVTLAEFNQLTEAGTTKKAEINGIVEEVLPNALFRVRLDDGQVVSAGISNTLRHAIVRLIAGHRVTVEVSSRDPHRGQITKKL